MEENKKDAVPQWVDLSYLEGRTVAILGYDHYGYDHARKLRDRGISVVVALRHDSSPELWEKTGFQVVSIWEAIDAADVVQIW